MKYLNEIKRKIFKDLKKEVNKEFEENIHTWLYMKAINNSKIERGLQIYRPKSIKIIIDWELENERE